MIERIDSRDASAFAERYYATETPVILTGVAQSGADATALWRSLADRIARDDSAVRKLLWVDVTPEVVTPLCPTPPVVQSLLDPARAHVRRNFVRVWFHHRGHVTPWHYDGNSLHVFNLQLAGRKRWRIVSPETPLTCIPFSNACLFDDYTLQGKRHHDFVLESGEMLFLPRHWFHWVESLAEANVNVNWVLSPKSTLKPSPTSRRDAEILWLRRRLDRRPSEMGDVDEIIARSVSAAAGVGRLLRELLRLPLFLVYVPVRLARLLTLRRRARSSEAS